jgi:hypothetical protein
MDHYVVIVEMLSRTQFVENVIYLDDVSGPSLLIDMAKLCLSPRSKDRPRFSSILQTSVLIGSDFPALSPTVIAQKHKWGYETLPDTVIELMHHQLEKMTAEKRRIKEKRDEMIAQLSRLEQQLPQVDSLIRSIDDQIETLPPTN